MPTVTQSQLIPVGEQLLFDYISNDLSVIYDRICSLADRLFKRYNPCNIHTTKKGFILCKQYYHYSFVADYQEQGRFLCCSGCKFQSKSGCYIKCLPCKLFTCGAIKNKIVIKRLYKLRHLAERYGIDLFPYYRTKNEILSNSLKLMGNKL